MPIPKRTSNMASRYGTPTLFFTIFTRTCKGAAVRHAQEGSKPTRNLVGATAYNLSTAILQRKTTTTAMFVQTNRVAVFVVVVAMLPIPRGGGDDVGGAGASRHLQAEAPLWTGCQCVPAMTLAVLVQADIIYKLHCGQADIIYKLHCASRLPVPAGLLARPARAHLGADDLVLVALDRVLLAHINAHRRVVLERVAAASDLRVAVDDADLHAYLVQEEQRRVALVD
eukprot:364836-Chlamydomonas_euryale.AAC.7